MPMKLMSVAIFFLLILSDYRINGAIPRVIGGQEAKPHEFPYMVSVQLKDVNFHFCGGSLISTRHVLTAAHCIKNPDKDPIVEISSEHVQVVLGDYSLSKPDGTEVKRNVEKIILHEDFMKPGLAKFHSDIAILVLSEEVIFTDAIKPICLLENEDVSRKLGTVAGWGATTSVKPAVANDILLKAELPVLHNQWCVDVFESNYVPESMICAGFPWLQDYKAFCMGDSGGPFLMKSSRSDFAIAGVVSFVSNRGCATERYPNVFTKVYPFTNWIKNITKNVVCIA